MNPAKLFLVSEMCDQSVKEMKIKASSPKTLFKDQSLIHTDRPINLTPPSGPAVGKKRAQDLLELKEKLGVDYDGIAILEARISGKSFLLSS